MSFIPSIPPAISSAASSAWDKAKRFTNWFLSDDPDATLTRRMGGCLAALAYLQFYSRPQSYSSAFNEPQAKGAWGLLTNNPIAKGLSKLKQDFGIRSLRSINSKRCCEQSRYISHTDKLLSWEGEGCMPIRSISIPQHTTSQGKRARVI